MSRMEGSLRGMWRLPVRLVVLVVAVGLSGCAAMRPAADRDRIVVAPESRRVFRDGMERLRAGESDAARAAFDQAVELSPLFVEAHRQIQNARRRLFSDRLRRQADFDRSGALEGAADDDQMSALWDEEGLQKVLGQLPDAGALLASLDATDVAALLDGPGFEPASADDQSALDRKKPVTCPECGHEFTP